MVDQITTAKFMIVVSLTSCLNLVNENATKVAV